MENRAETNYSASQNYIKIKKIKTKLFILQTHIGQENRKPKAKQNAFQIKNFRLSAYGTFQKFQKTSTFSLKDERVLPSISHTSSHISRLKKLKLCHTPITIHNQSPTNTI